MPIIGVKQMAKEKIRSKIQGKLKGLSLTDKKNIEMDLFNILTKSSLWKKATSIGLTISTDIEWDTKPIIEHAWEQNKKIAVPKCHVQTKQLIFYEINSFNELISGYANIKEPDPLKTKEVQKHMIDLLIVPGLAFDKLGYRIGFGGGYYDRLLQNTNMLTVSLVSELQLIDNVPKDHFDIPVNYLITETNIIKTNAK